MLDIQFKCSATSKQETSNVKVSSTIKSDTFDETNIITLFSLFFEFLYKNGLPYEIIKEFVLALSVEINNVSQDNQNTTDSYNCTLADCEDCDNILDCDKHDKLMAEEILPTTEKEKITISVKHITDLLNSEDYVNKFRELMQTNDNLLKMVLKNWLHVVHTNNIIK